MKILSPAGNMQSLKMAVYNGADEVYVGINDYNARNNIDGFTLDSLKNAVDFAHLYSVRVLLAINVLFTDEELNQAINTLISAYNLGVDAFIIQDLALAEIVSKTYPQIELHASTQMAIHNLEGVRFLERFNFKRVVLARETPLKEIKRIRQNSDIEIEYFVQGALCVSFSGNCYLSSYMFGASGNRGRCKQPCRLPYTLRYNGKNLKTGYLLSAKDFNMSLRLEDLKKAGVDCIKIEGRARRPYYVAMATREYYNAIHNKPVNQNNLKLAFNRSYVEGYFNGNGNIISKLQNHAGIYIGEVSAVEIGNKFNKVYIKSDKKIAPKSVLKFLHNDKEMGVITAFDIKDSQDGFMVTTTQKLNKGYSVHLISDAFSEEQALSYTAKIKIDLVVEFCLNKKAKVTASIKDNVVCHQSEFILESAKNSPLTQQELADCFNKNEYFDCQIKVSELDGVFVAKSMLNGFRRDFFDKLINQITQKYYRNVKAIKIQKPSQINTFSDFVYVNKITKKVSQKTLYIRHKNMTLKI